MHNLLDEIVQARRVRLAEDRRRRSSGDLEAEMPGLQTKDMVAALSGPGMSLIAEFKRRSPSAGELAAGRSPSETAKRYEDGGASAMSVLTEPDFFGGSLDDLQAAKDACELPILRKDFIIDTYQLLEARVQGADAVLLIAAVLHDGALLSDLSAAARDLGLWTIVEIHDEMELAHALAYADPRIIGVNQRDLRTFEVDTRLVARLRPQIPSPVVVVAESGIGNAEQLRELEGIADAALIGEMLMRSDDPSQVLRALLGADRA